MIEQLNTLKLKFEGGKILHDEELNQIVNHINDVVGHINSTIIPAIENIHDGQDGQDGQDGKDGQNGKDGQEGISSLNAFVGAGDAAEALLKLGNRSQTVYPPGQYSISSNVQINPGEVLFMTSARRRGEKDWIFGEDNYIWSIPVQLGVGNTTSTTGVDTDKLNYIYCRTFRDIDAAYTSQASLQSIILNYIEEHPGSGVKIVNNQLSYIIDLDNDTDANINGAWTDHPYGINETFPHEWMVGYKKNEQDQWEYYFGPIMISNYGFNGLDGDGYEYIFARNDTRNSAPSIDYTANNNKTRNDDDFIPLGWTDEPQGVFDNIGCHYEWVATRKKFGNPAVWHDFSPPSIWGQYAAPGKQGQYRQWAYKNAVSIELNEIPESNNIYPPGDWTSTASTPDFAKGEYTWCIDRIVTFDVNNQPVYGNWSNPYRITGNSGQGNMYYPAGEYNSLIEYTRNNNVCPIVHYTDPNNVDSGYWYLNSSTNIINNEHIAPSSTLDNPWKKAENYGMVITEVLFTQFAKVGSFIVSGDFFISQHGTLFNDSGEVEVTSSRTIGSVYTQNNTPYLALSTGDIACYTYFDSSDPMVETLPTYGNYKFRPMKVINARTGEEWMAEGKVHVSANGNVEITGVIRATTLYQSFIDYNPLWGSGQYVTEISANKLLSDIGGTFPNILWISSRDVESDREDLYTAFEIHLPNPSLYDGHQIEIICSKRAHYTSLNGDESWNPGIQLHLPDSAGHDTIVWSNVQEAESELNILNYQIRLVSVMKNHVQKWFVLDYRDCEFTYQ